jgi:uncharacterized protein
MTPGRERDRDPAGRPRNARSRDALGRPLPRGVAGFAPYDDPALPPDQALETAQRLIDEGRPFTAHEVLEAVWKQTDGEERELWRGLAQLAVGITHLLRGNQSGSAALLRRAAEHLAGFAGSSPYGVPVDRLRAWALAPTGAPPPLVGSGSRRPQPRPLDE